jgi:hypothetical protein
MPTYVEILQAMHRSKADYVWIGLSAAAVHGSPLVSNDFDFFIRPDPKHLDRARAAFRKLEMDESWAKVSSDNLIAWEVTDTFVDRCGGPTVDLITHISGPSFTAVWEGSDLRKVTHLPVRVASLKHILDSKRAANREKDREVLKRLERDFGDLLREVRPAYKVKRRKVRKQS